MLNLTKQILLTASTVFIFLSSGCATMSRTVSDGQLKAQKSECMVRSDRFFAPLIVVNGNQAGLDGTLLNRQLVSMATDGTIRRVGLIPTFVGQCAQDGCTFKIGLFREESISDLTAAKIEMKMGLFGSDTYTYSTACSPKEVGLGLAAHLVYIQQQTASSQQQNQRR